MRGFGTPLRGRCGTVKAINFRTPQVKGYHDIVRRTEGPRILEQVAEQRARITDGLARVRHLMAVGSGKGGVSKAP